MRPRDPQPPENKAPQLPDTVATILCRNARTPKLTGNPPVIHAVVHDRREN